MLLSVAAGWFLARQALQPIDEMLRQQRQFMTDGSHELRTPLSVLSSAADVTLDSPNATTRIPRGVDDRPTGGAAASEAG